MEINSGFKRLSQVPGSCRVSLTFSAIWTCHLQAKIPFI